MFAKKNKLKEKTTRHENIGKESYKLPSYAFVSINIPGVRRNQADIFDFISSRRISPPIQNRQNIPLTEVELERLTLLNSPMNWSSYDVQDKINPSTEKHTQNSEEKFIEFKTASHDIYFGFLPGSESPQRILYSYSHRLWVWGSKYEYLSRIKFIPNLERLQFYI